MTTTPETDLAAPYEPAQRPEDAQQPPAPDSPQNALQVAPSGTSPAGFGSATAFELLQRQAKMMASSDLVPAPYKGSVANCAIALEIAARVGCSPLMVAQNLDVIKGRPGWRGKYVIGAVNSHPKFADGGGLEFIFSGKEGSDDWSCYAQAKRSDGKMMVGPTVSIRMAKAEGWYQKPGSKWQTLPGLMLPYRAGSFFGNLHVPEVLMGMPTAEELQDIDGAKTAAKAELVNRFQPVLEAEMLMRPEECPHTAGPRTKQTYEGPDEPASLSEVCAGCDTPWSQCQPKGGE